jgi:hypothetical protein
MVRASEQMGIRVIKHGRALMRAGRGSAEAKGTTVGRGKRPRQRQADKWRASFSPWSLGRRRWAASTALEAATSSGQAKVLAKILSKTSTLLRVMASVIVALTPPNILALSSVGYSSTRLAQQLLLDAAAAARKCRGGRAQGWLCCGQVCWRITAHHSYPSIDTRQSSALPATRGAFAPLNLTASEAPMPAPSSIVLLQR